MVLEKCTVEPKETFQERDAFDDHAYATAELFHCLFRFSYYYCLFYDFFTKKSRAVTPSDVKETSSRRRLIDRAQLEFLIEPSNIDTLAPLNRSYSGSQGKTAPKEVNGVSSSISDIDAPNDSHKRRRKARRKDGKQIKASDFEGDLFSEHNIDAELSDADVSTMHTDAELEPPVTQTVCISLSSFYQ